MKTQRILSIDVFRGLTIFLMVFVNELAGVSNIPQWMKHRPADFDGMTFVDVVFPAFLFIVGMAIPFAVKARQSRGDTIEGFWLHVILRTAGLLILGVFMVNSGEMNREANLIPYGLWTCCFYLSAVLIWNRYPQKVDIDLKRIFNALKIIGLLSLVVLFFLFRKGPNDLLTGMTPSWWGILGLIGWAYLISMVMYFIGRHNIIAMALIFLVLLALQLGLRSSIDIFPFNLDWLKGQTGHIAHSLLTLSGIICSLLLRKGDVLSDYKTKILSMLIIGAGLAVLAYFIRPYGGISKIYATPAWALYCSAICFWVFPFVYWLVDIKGINKWANFLKPAGQNPLLTYILPPFIYAAVGYSFYPAWLKNGVIGICWSVIFTLIIVYISKWLTKKGIRLHL